MRIAFWFCGGLFTILPTVRSVLLHAEQQPTCAAACQIHGVHVLWEESDDREKRGAMGDRPSIHRRILKGSNTLPVRGGHDAANNHNDVLFFACRTLWDDTSPSEKYLPVHEVGLPFRIVENYDAESLEDGVWAVCYSGGPPDTVETPTILGQNTTGHIVSSYPSSNILSSDAQLNLTKDLLALDKGRASLRQLGTPPDDPFHRTGLKTLLVVRITTLRGEEPTASRMTMKRSVFGPLRRRIQQTGRVSMAEQYSLISHGQLNLIPLRVPRVENNLVHGVMDVFFAGFNGRNIQLLTRDLVRATERALRLESDQQLRDVADHTIFCLPDEAHAPLFGNIDDWTAFTYRYEPYSFYRKNRCSRLSVVLHELGHATLGFRHSGAYLRNLPSHNRRSSRIKINGVEVFEDEYGDETGYMGYSVNLFGRPRKAMNAHKHWLSRWYNDHSMLTFDPFDSGPGQIQLVGYTHYEVSDWTVAVAAKRERAVLARVGNLFFQYNAVVNDTTKDWNVDTAYPNTVTIVRTTGEDSMSFLVAILEPGSAHVDKNYMNTGDTVVIGVCPQQFFDGSGAPFVLVNVHLQEEGMDMPSCQLKDPTPLPTSRPTPQPSSLFKKHKSPTFRPTLSPAVVKSPTLETPNQFSNSNDDNLNNDGNKASKNPDEGVDIIADKEEDNETIDAVETNTTSTPTSTESFSRSSSLSLVVKATLVSVFAILSCLVVGVFACMVVLRRRGQLLLAKVDRKNSGTTAMKQDEQSSCSSSSEETMRSHDDED